MIDKEDQVLEVYKETLSLIDKLITDHDPLVIAGVMMAQSLSLYKSILSEEDFSSIVTSIMEKKDKVYTFTSRNLH
jgi:hypothetical protein